MSLTDPIGDMLARIKNSQLRNHKKVEMPSSNFKMKIADVLKNEGYIESFEVIGDNKKDLYITLKYYKGSPLINKIEKITKQGCRVYSSVEDIPKTIGGLGTTILSTSKGVMSDSDARNQKVGGEVLISVF